MVTMNGTGGKKQLVWIITAARLHRHRVRHPSTHSPSLEKPSQFMGDARKAERPLTGKEDMDRFIHFQSWMADRPDRPQAGSALEYNTLVKKVYDGLVEELPESVLRNQALIWKGHHDKKLANFLNDLQNTTTAAHTATPANTNSSPNKARPKATTQVGITTSPVTESAAATVPAPERAPVNTNPFAQSTPLAMSSTSKKAQTPPSLPSKAQSDVNTPLPATAPRVNNANSSSGKSEPSISGPTLKPSRGSNRYNIFQEWLRDQPDRPVASDSQSYNDLVRERYNALTDKEKEEGSVTWRAFCEAKVKAAAESYSQRDVVTKGKDLVPFMKKLAAQFLELGQTIAARTHNDVQTITIITSRNVIARQASAIISTDENITRFIDANGIVVSEFIERLSNMLFGIQSGLIPSQSLTTDQIASALLGSKGEANSHPQQGGSAASSTTAPAASSSTAAAASSSTAVAASSTAAAASSSSSTTATSSTAAASNASEPTSNAQEDQEVQCIDSGAHNADRKPLIKIEDKDDGDKLRGRVRLWFTELLVSLIHERDTRMWGVHLLKVLLKHKIRLIWPKDHKILPGDPQWQPNRFPRQFNRRIVKLLDTGTPIDFVRFEPWPADFVSISERDPRFATIPVVLDADGTVLRVASDEPDYAKRYARTLVEQHDGGPGAPPLARARVRAKGAALVNQLIDANTGALRSQASSNAVAGSSSTATHTNRDVLATLTQALDRLRQPQLKHPAPGSSADVPMVIDETENIPRGRSMQRRTPSPHSESPSPPRRHRAGPRGEHPRPSRRSPSPHS
ncbi:hypothetical protein NMY22_g19586 [Coprinellus aureogranulatus]|nr:hypothetical protein NMY22_g19586 [Coprinellus aureogranulatus]